MLWRTPPSLFVRLAAADRRAKPGFGYQQQERHPGWDYHRDLGQTRTWKPRNTESSFYAKGLDYLRSENLPLRPSPPASGNEGGARGCREPHAVQK